MANIEILNITSSTKTILLDAVGSDGTSFTVTVCARYTGRGFSGRPLSKIHVYKSCPLRNFHTKRDCCFVVFYV